MSRLTLTYGESAIAAAKLSGLANSFGSEMFEWLCTATTIWCRAAKGTTRFIAERVDEAVMISAPSARAISKPRSISSSENESSKL